MKNKKGALKVTEKKVTLHLQRSLQIRNPIHLIDFSLYKKFDHGISKLPFFRIFYYYCSEWHCVQWKNILIIWDSPEITYLCSWDFPCTMHRFWKKAKNPRIFTHRAHIEARLSDKMEWTAKVARFVSEFFPCFSIVFFSIRSINS